MPTLADPFKPEGDGVTDGVATALTVTECITEIRVFVILEIGVVEVDSTEVLVRLETVVVKVDSRVAVVELDFGVGMVVTATPELTAADWGILLASRSPHVWQLGEGKSGLAARQTA